MLVEGRIIKIISNLYTVWTEKGIIDCRARGKFRFQKITPIVGDLCQVDFDNRYILAILPRKNSLTRPLIANVDSALILVSVKKPDLSLSLLDKMLTTITLNQIEPILCFSKLDLMTKDEKTSIENIMAYYANLGYPVFKNTELKKLMRALQHKIIVITGQTGAGKSTLLNNLDPHLHLQTDEISESLGRGKHTTRHVELFAIANFYIADTPGFSSLDLQEFSAQEIKNSFPEFAYYSCAFPDCSHTKERDCQVKEAVSKGQILKSRYENYLTFIGNKREI